MIRIGEAMRKVREAAFSVQLLFAPRPKYDAKDDHKCKLKHIMQTSLIAT